MPLATSVNAVAACSLAGLATVASANVLEGARAELLGKQQVNPKEPKIHQE